MKQILAILLIILLGGVAIFGLRALLIGLGVSQMAALAFSNAGVGLAAGALFWLGGLKWFGIDSPRNRSIALAVCLAYGGQSLMLYFLHLAGVEQKLADTLATITWMVFMIAALFWLVQKRENKDNP